LSYPNQYQQKDDVGEERMIDPALIFEVMP
jgi:hypothetical protein